MRPTGSLSLPNATDRDRIYQPHVITECYKNPLKQAEQDVSNIRKSCLAYSKGNAYISVPSY